MLKKTFLITLLVTVVGCSVTSDEQEEEETPDLVTAKYNVEEYIIPTYSVETFDGYNSILNWTSTIYLDEGVRYKITTKKVGSTLYPPEGWGDQDSSVLGYELGTLVGATGSQTINNFKVGKAYAGKASEAGILSLVVDVHIQDQKNDKNGKFKVKIEYWTIN